MGDDTQSEESQGDDTASRLRRLDPLELIGDGADFLAHACNESPNQRLSGLAAGGGRDPGFEHHQADRHRAL